jgi:hypothetical protein
MGQITDLLRKSSDFSDLAEFFRSCRSDYIVASGLATINPERLGRPLGRLSSSRLADESVMMQVTRLHTISRMTEEIIFR